MKVNSDYAFKKYYKKNDEWVNTGDSAIVNPDGKFIAGPLNRAEGILYAEVDTAQAAGLRWQLDIAGHYARPDVFMLTVNRASLQMIQDKKGESWRERPDGEVLDHEADCFECKLEILEALELIEAIRAEEAH
jgi:predicted amidohydrolase